MILHLSCVSVMAALSDDTNSYLLYPRHTLKIRSSILTMLTSSREPSQSYTHFFGRNLHRYWNDHWSEFPCWIDFELISQRSSCPSTWHNGLEGGTLISPHISTISKVPCLTYKIKFGKWSCSSILVEVLFQQNFSESKTCSLWSVLWSWVVPSHTS